MPTKHSRVYEEDRKEFDHLFISAWWSKMGIAFKEGDYEAAYKAYVDSIIDYSKSHKQQVKRDGM